MSDIADAVNPLSLLHYRPWHGQTDNERVATRASLVLLFLLGEAVLVSIMFMTGLWPILRFFAALTFLASWILIVRTRAWPIARASLAMIFRRKLFWAIYTLALLVFLLFFFGQYLMSWAIDQLGEQEVRVGGIGRANPKVLVDVFRNALKLDGSQPEMYRNFFWYEGYCVMIVLALAGSILIGNDLRYGSLPFYLSKPISRWDYLLGKGLAVCVFINLFTTIPALVLFGEICILEDLEYFFTKSHLIAGILAYGLILSGSLTCILLATATWVQRTVPLIMTWTTLFFFCRVLANALVDRMEFDARWRLIDLWNSTYLLGNLVLGIAAENVRPAHQPVWYEAASVVLGVSLLCLSYLILRIRGVEIVK